MTKRNEELLYDFKDSLYIISSSASAGRTLIKALKDACESLYLTKGDSNLLYNELNSIIKRYEINNESIEQLFYDFAVRSSFDEIVLFAKALEIARTTGSDMEEVCLNCSLTLIEKIEYKKELDSLLSEKKMDIVILVIIPVAVLFFLNISSYDYVAVLYETLTGRIIMTFLLMMMTASVLWSLRIMKLKL